MRLLFHCKRRERAAVPADLRKRPACLPPRKSPYAVRKNSRRQAQRRLPAAMGLVDKNATL